MKRTNGTHRENDTRDDAAGRSTRRTFVRGVGAVGLGVAGGQYVTGTASAEWSSPHLDDYGTVVDMVEDAGADPTGEESVTPLLEEYADDDTLLLFPSGRYRMHSQFRFTGFQNFGILGKSDVTLVPDDFQNFDDGSDWNYRLFRLGISYNPGTDLLVKNLTVDQTAEDTGVRVIEAAVDDGLHVENVEIIGEHDSGAWGPGRFVVMDQDGSGVVRNFSATDGAAWTENAPADKLWRGPSGIVCNDFNRGTMRFENCSLGDFPDNGLYAANGSGQVIVDGGTYKNSQTASLRIGGTDSIVRNATVVVDDARDRGNQHAIRAENSNYVRIQNCDVRVSDPNGDAISTFDVDLLLLENSTVTTGGDEAVHALHLGDDTGVSRIKTSTFDHGAAGGFSVWIRDGEGEVNVEDCTFVGDGGHVSARAAVRCDRPSCTFRDLDVRQTGSSRRRAIELHADDCMLIGGKYVGRENPIINYGDDTWIESVHANSVDDHASVLLYDTGSGVYIKKSVLEDGIQNRGSDDLKLWDNSYNA